MEHVRFLNIEYLLLRVYEALHGLPVVSVAYSEAVSPVSNALTVIAGFLGSIALLGMLLTLALFVLLVWVHIKATILEHEGHEEEHKKSQVTIITEAASAHTPKNIRWERVQELANTQNESDWRLAILESDIMLDDLLKDQGYRGEGVGQKFLDANPLQFTTLDLARQAHKVRNDIAHAGVGFHLSQREANATIDLYRRVFEEFDFI